MYFTFNGIDSRDMKIVVLKSPLIKTPTYRRYTTDIPGRHGEYIRTEGFTSHTLSFEVAIEGTEDDVIKVIGWLSGRGEFSFSAQPDRFLEVDQQSELEAVWVTDNLYTMTINFYAHDATWFKKGKTSISKSATSIKNNGTVNSKPIIKLIRGDVQKADVTINEVRFVYDFKGEDHVIIDCENMEAYRGASKRNIRLDIGYAFPILKPGNNTISTNVGMEFERKDRWL